MADYEAAALVLSAEKASELGFVGAGPFTFPGFPGAYTIGQPLRVTELGFAEEHEARAAHEATFATDSSPLEWTTVTGEDGFAQRENHAPTEAQVRAAQVAEDRAGIRTHADADEAAAAAGMPPFPDSPRLTVAEKVDAIEAFKLAAPLEPADVAPEAEEE